MRISDWSSDVCSSDLDRVQHHRVAALGHDLAQDVDAFGFQPVEMVQDRWPCRDRLGVGVDLGSGGHLSGFHVPGPAGMADTSLRPGWADAVSGESPARRKDRKSTRIKSSK